MTESKPMPKFISLDELVEFFETHDLGEYWDRLPETHFDINLKERAYIFVLAEDLAEKLNALAKAKRVPSEQLINTWLREKLLEQAQ